MGLGIEIKLDHIGWRILIDGIKSEKVHTTERLAIGAVETAAQDIVIRQAIKEVKARFGKS